MSAGTEAPVQSDAVIDLDPMYLFRWEEPQQSYVLLYPEGVVKLNQTASSILKLCDGTRTVGQIVAELESQFHGEGITQSVHKFLEVSHAKGWIRINA